MTGRTGRFGASYDRSVASFTASRLPIKDMLDTLSYFAEASHGVGANWFLLASARHAETTHGAQLREFNHVASDSWKLGIEYAAGPTTQIGVDYRYTEASFPNNSAFTLRSFGDRYEENTASLRLRHNLGNKTSLEGFGGYLQRRYPNAADNFQGGMWRAALTWEPTVKTQLVWSAWRELTAYVDAESDYFVSRGLALSPIWKATDKLAVSVKLGWEEQNYLAATPVQSAPSSFAARNDRLRYGTLTLLYAPIRSLEFTLAARIEERASNRPLFDYSDEMLSLGARLKIGA